FPRRLRIHLEQPELAAAINRDIEGELAERPELFLQVAGGVDAELLRLLPNPLGLRGAADPAGQHRRHRSGPAAAMQIAGDAADRPDPCGTAGRRPFAPTVLLHEQPVIMDPAVVELDLDSLLHEIASTPKIPAGQLVEQLRSGDARRTD